MAKRRATSYLKLLETALTEHLGWNVSGSLKASLQSTVESKASRLGFEPMIYAHRAATNEIELHTLADEISQRALRVSMSQAQFLFLGAALLSQLAESVPNGGPLGIWSIGAPAGVEPFLPLIAIAELKLPPKNKHRVLLTEWRASVLQKVALGRFTESELNVLPLGLREKYFVRVPTGGEDVFQISDQIRVMLHAERKNVLRGSGDDTPQRFFDLVLAPGSLVFLTDWARRKLLHRLRMALRTGGILAVSETGSAFIDDEFLAKIENGPKGFFQRLPGD